MGWFEEMEKLVDDLEAEDNRRRATMCDGCRRNVYRHQNRCRNGARCRDRNVEGTILEQDDTVMETMRDLIGRMP